jgi:NAD(P)-dependent dehydrogenase (short-subunit alcohol dehydrogenase family)
VSKVIVVTGASAGVGRASAVAFGRRGDRVALLARGADGLAATAREVREAGGQPLGIACDMSDPDAVDAAAGRIEADLGEIDVWVNDAMTAVLAYSWDIAPEDYRRVIEVNYLGFVHGTLAALRHMRPRDRGTIVQVGSALAHRSIPLQATYCASKFAIRGFTDSVRCELMHDGSHVRLTMVQLPGLNTPQFDWVRTTLRRRPKPVAPVYQPEIAARAVVWAAEHRRRELFVGANTAAVIWGSRIAPWAADRYLARTNISAQQDPDVPIDPQARTDNLYAPVPGDHGTHGPYDDRAHGRSAQLVAATHRGAVAAGLAAASGMALAAATAARRKR